MYSQAIDVELWLIASEVYHEYLPTEHNCQHRDTFLIDIYENVSLAIEVTKDGIVYNLFESYSGGHTPDFKFVSIAQCLKHYQVWANDMNDEYEGNEWRIERHFEEYPDLDAILN